MTMQHQIHPDDERLAALAGADPDVAADAELRAHVSACAQCSDLTAELTTLRSALAELPDLVPSRRLQLIPPVAEPRAARGGWMRRLAGPVMAAGFGIVLVGAVGTSGVLNALSPSSAGQTVQNIGEELDSASPRAAEGAPTLQSGGDDRSLAGEYSPVTAESSQDLGAASRTDAAEDGDDVLGAGRELFSDSDPRLPWLVLIGLGVGVLLAGVYLRFSAEPRAG